MKKFLKNLFIFIFPIFISLVFLEIVLRRIPNDYSLKKTYLDKRSKDLEVIFMGSSHTYFGIDPKFIKRPSFNASHISQSLKLDFSIIEKYSGRWNNLKFIVVPVDYFSLSQEIETDAEEWRLKNYNIYYDIRERRKLADYFELLNGTFKGNMSRATRYIKKNKNDITCTELGWGTIYRSKYNKDLELTGKTAAIRHTYENESLVKYNVSVLQELINFAKEINVKVIIITSPAYRSYVENLDKIQLSNTIDAISSLEKLNSNVKYYNFLSDPLLTAKDFYDGDHLNETGAEIFSNQVDHLLATESLL